MCAYFALNIFSVIFLRMTELFASPPSKGNSMVVMPFASLTHKSVILFVSLSVTALPSLPSKLALKHTPSNINSTQQQIVFCTNLELSLSLLITAFLALPSN